MTAQPRLGLARSWSWITSAYLIDVAVLILASQSPRAPQTVACWVGVAVMAVVTIAFLLTYRGITLASALARWVWDVSADPETSGAAERPFCAVLPALRSTRLAVVCTCPPRVA